MTARFFESGGVLMIEITIEADGNSHIREATEADKVAFKAAYAAFEGGSED